jgi:hypothetical protein
LGFWTLLIQAIETFFRDLERLFGMASATGKVTANVTLLDSAGNPVPSQQVSVTYVLTGSTGVAPVNFATITTDANGKGSASGNVNAPGTYDFTATYAGEAGVYDPATPAVVTGVKVTASVALTLAIIIG